MMRWVIASVMVAMATPAIAQSLDLPLRKFLSGLEVSKYGFDQLLVSRGVAADSGGTIIARFENETIVDLQTVGCNGLDQGSPVEGATYQVYTIHNPTTGQVCFLVSRGIRLAYGPDQFGNTVVWPAGYDPHRKLRFGFRYLAAWDGIPDFHLSYWPLPKVSLTNAEADAPYRVAQNLTSVNTWTSVQVGHLMPDAARYVHLAIQLDAVGTAGTCYLRTTASQAIGFVLGGVTPTTIVAPAGMWSLRTTGNAPGGSQSIQVKTTGGCRIKSMTLMGYDMSEHS